ncbi:MAG: hemolysin family protein, partial [Actinobacteria bacterium]|nr:hemolysin family protein [Actinomycetota bacterium]
LAGFLSAGFGASQIAPSLEVVLVSWGMPPTWAGPIAFIFVTVVIAYISLVLGELVPKRIALQRLERVAMFAATPVYLISRIFRPFIWALSVSTNFVVRLFGIDPRGAKGQISGAELRDLVAAHEDLTVEERELIDDVFAAGDRELREVMVPRTEVDFMDANMPVQQAVKTIRDQPHSRYPVSRDSADDVIGFVHVRDILDPELADSPIRVGSLVREITAFPGTNAVLSTLTEMRRLRQHLAIVVDEYGGTAGIVSLEDLVEELIGDIKDEYDVITRHEEVKILGVITVDGLLNLEDFADETGLQLPDGPYETVAGFLIARLGALPEVGATVECENHEFEVTELDGRRVARVRVTPIAPLHPPHDHTQVTEPGLQE